MSTNYERYQTGLIKSLLAQPEELNNVLQIVNIDDIEDGLLNQVYSAMIELELQKEKVSLPGIALEIQKTGASIDPSFLFSLEENIVSFVSSANPTQWAVLTKQESSRVKAQSLIFEKMEELKDVENIPLEVIQTMLKDVEDLSKTSMINKRRTIKEIADDYAENQLRIQEEGITRHRVLSPYPSIDRYTGGWGPQQMITVGARTGIGKSVFAVNNAISAMQADESVLFFSLEMSEEEILARFIAAMAMLNVGDVEQGKLTPEEQIKHDETLDIIRNSKLTLETEGQWTIEEIKAKAMEVAQSENGLDFIILDYLQLMSVARPGNKSRQEIVAEISRSVKNLAKELDIPIMVLVQLNSRVEDPSIIPTLAEIRESGAIAQDSNVIVLIHRDKDSEAIDPKATFILEKNRQGKDKVFTQVRSMLECSLFIDDRERFIPDSFNQSSLDGEEPPMHEFNSYPVDYSDDYEYMEDNSSDFYTTDELSDIGDISFGDLDWGEENV